MSQKGAKRKAREIAAAEQNVKPTTPAELVAKHTKRYAETHLIDESIWLMGYNNYKNKQQLSTAVQMSDNNQILECLKKIPRFEFAKSVLGFCAMHNLQDVANYYIKNKLEKPTAADVMTAIINDRLYFIDLYLRNGVDANSVIDEFQNTFVHIWARDSQKISVLKLLQKYGAKIDVENKFSETPIYMMIYTVRDAFYPTRTYIPALEYMLKYVNPNHSIGASTVLDKAIDAESDIIVSMLKRNGAQRYSELAQQKVR